MVIKTIQYNVNSLNLGNLRSLIRQTRTVSAAQTKHMQRGTLLFMASEQLPGKHYVKQVKQEDLMKVDIWQLGITLFCLVNPGLSAPFDKFEKITNKPEFPEELIAN